MSSVWFVTGAGRGFGIDIAKQALAAGHSVVATGRNPDAVLQAIGAHQDLLPVALDITDPQAALTASGAARARIEPCRCRSRSATEHALLAESGRVHVGGA